MGYENVDETARREACEKLKQIVKAIKAIKIRYYLNFSKISEKDQETYKKLQANLETISESHNLHNLKVALMSEIEARYDRNDDNMRLGKSTGPDSILEACYGAVDAQKEALSHGKIGQATKCQEILKSYMQQIDSLDVIGLIINYKREKFAELVRTRDEVEGQNFSWNKRMRDFYHLEHVMERQDAISIITNIPNKTKQNEELLTI